MDGGGAFMNQSVHYADLVCWLCGQPQVLSAACGAVAHDIEVEDVALALFRFGSGGLGVLEATTCAYPGYRCTLRISGTRGTVVLEDGAIVSGEFRGEDRGTVAGDVGGLKMPDGHRAQLADVISAISSGRPPSVDRGRRLPGAQVRARRLRRRRMGAGGQQRRGPKNDQI